MIYCLQNSTKNFVKNSLKTSRSTLGIMCTESKMIFSLLISMQCWIVILDTCASQLSEKRHPAQTSISHITFANFASCEKGEFQRTTLNKVWIYEIGNVVFSGLNPVHVILFTIPNQWWVVLIWVANDITYKSEAHGYYEFCCVS